MAEGQSTRRRNRDRNRTSQAWAISGSAMRAAKPATRSRPVALRGGRSRRSTTPAHTRASTQPQRKRTRARAQRLKPVTEFPYRITFEHALPHRPPQLPAKAAPTRPSRRAARSFPTMKWNIRAIAEGSRASLWNRPRLDLAGKPYLDRHRKISPVQSFSASTVQRPLIHPSPLSRARPEGTRSAARIPSVPLPTAATRTPASESRSYQR